MTTGGGSIYDMAIDAEDRIVVAGKASGPTVPADLAVLRYTPDGDLDTTFHDDGIVTVDLRGTRDMAVRMLIQPDGKILAGGLSDKYPDGGMYASSPPDATNVSG